MTNFDQENKKLYLSNQLINNEALKRGIEVDIINADQNFVCLSYNRKNVYLKATNIPPNNSVSATIANHKNLTNILLERFDFPVPKRGVARNIDEVIKLAEKLDYPVVLKSPTGSGGTKVYPNICGPTELEKFADELFKNDELVILEKHVSGCDYRFLIVDFECVSILKRIPAFVVGDGVKNIEQLVEEENQNPLRQAKHTSSLMKIVIDGETRRILKDSKIDTDTVPAKKQKVTLKYTANQSKGGATEIVTNEVHSENKKLAEDIARKFNLRLVGVDFMAEDISKSHTQQKLFVIEINAIPCLGMHYQPSFGKGEDVSPYIIDLLFPETKNN
ncbi:hypothetical protein ACFL24_00430 [Patescibacteria group bacterium]